MPKKRGKKPSLEEISKKLDELLAAQRVISKEEKKVEEKEEQLEKIEELELAKEEKVKELEEKELTELEKIERFEKELEKRIVAHPLKKITYKDIARGIIGAFFGAVAHYTFIYGLKVAELITFNRATLLFVISFFIGAIFLYATGFRKIKDRRILIFLPIRLITLYVISIVMSMVVLYLFIPNFGASFEEAYKQVASVSLVAVIGACTADIIAKD